jgi:hypothetical protein
MTSRHTLTVALAIATLLASYSSALAGGSLPIVTRVAGSAHPPLVSLRTGHHGMLVARDVVQDAGLIKIANNLTQYKNSPYWGWSGYAICGPQGGCADATEQWLATAFTPKTSHLATRIEVPALYYSGTNGVVLSVYDDAGGVPGKPLHSWRLTNLPSVACCTVVGGSDKHGIPLTGGKQYWIVISTDTQDATSVALWALTEFAGVQKHGSSFAIYCSGSGCTQIGYKENAWNIMANMIYGLAFSVLGPH